jgi:NADH-quinone oxidoreductase subunit E
MLMSFHPSPANRTVMATSLPRLIFFFRRKPMTVAYKEGDFRALVHEAITKHGSHRDALIPILSEVNAALGYIPAEAIHEIRQQVNDPRTHVFTSESQLYSMASFYQMLSTKPRGRHVVKFCENAPCHVMGGREVWQALQEALQLGSGQTSLDGKWTLMTTSCLGVCSVGPVFLVDEDIYGNVTPSQVADILAKYT